MQVHQTTTRAFARASLLANELGRRARRIEQPAAARSIAAEVIGVTLMLAVFMTAAIML